MVTATLLDTSPYIDLPYHLIGWLGWFGLAAVLFWGLRKKIQIVSSKKFWTVFLVILAFSLLLPLFFGIKLPWQSSLPLPNITRESSSPVIMIFSAIPWMLAAGILGFWPAVAIGFATGLVTALWNTHNLFTPLETASLALLISYAFRQNYRSRIFQWLRRPIGAAVAVAFISVPVYLLTTFFGTNGSLAARLDYAFTQSWMLMLVNAVQIIFAGFVLDLALVTKSKYWIKQKSFVPSPYETGLQEKVFYIALPIIFVLLLTLAIADWIVAGKAAEKMLESRLKSTAEIAAENIPSLIDTGQGLLLDMVDSHIPMDLPETAHIFLKEKIRSIPFFTQFFLFDLTGAPLTGYPLTDINQYVLTPEEVAGVQLALNGVLIQSYVIAPVEGDNSAQVAYIAAIPDEYGLAKGVISARTNLGVNLFSQPALLALQEIHNAGGEGVILDGQNRILYDSNPNLILTTYQGRVPENSEYFEDTSGTGTRRMVYASISEAKDWKILLSLPASTTQDLSLQIAIPLLAISILISIGAYMLLRFMVGSLAKSLVQLANQADEISKGSLDQKIAINGVDEVGRLSAAFEQMRTSLKSRLDELDVLLDVSKGVASNFEIGKTSAHLLKACLSYGADSARLILKNGYSFGFDEETISFSAGAEADEYSELDKLLIDQMGTDKVLVIPSKPRIRRIGSIRGPTPSAVVAMMIADDATDYGMLWIAYAEAHRFYDEEIRFLNTIAGQAVLAISNSSLFMNAEVGKKRLESVLSSTPEPVLVVGESGRLLMANEAAENVVGLIETSGEGEHIVAGIKSVEFIDFLNGNRDKVNKTGEISIDGKIFEISVSPVKVENAMVGTVCVLRDITEFRDMEKMKSDFVATVSHDLRAPMGIVRGYATMLQMVGELNEQQKEYANKMINDLDVIDQMVDKLLDLGRIESGSVLQLEKIAPMDLFDEVMKVLQPLATQRKVQIMRELTIAQSLEIDADKALLQQALYNLLDNAIKFSPLGGKIALRLQVNPENVVFEIQDHGPGIAPLDIDKIFDKLSRNGSKDNGGLKGSGLGLSIVKSIAERHHGKVWAVSTLGKGSTFFLQVPITQIDKPEKEIAR
jgi:PAS domain S-box-containing protein